LNDDDNGIATGLSMIKEHRPGDAPAEKRATIRAREGTAGPKTSPPLSAGDDERALDQVADVIGSLLKKADAKDLSFKTVFATLERNVIVKTLSAFNGHQAKTANYLGLLATTLSAKMKKHGIVLEHKGMTDSGSPAQDDAAGGAGSDSAEARDPDLDPDS
jgi:DNA-binding protein Fis